ncbi:hypothetical protein KCU65_g75, partial [Aureobasidium melanogenum]
MVVGQLTRSRPVHFRLALPHRSRDSRRTPALSLFRTKTMQVENCRNDNKDGNKRACDCQNAEAKKEIKRRKVVQFGPFFTPSKESRSVLTIPRHLKLCFIDNVGENMLKYDPCGRFGIVTAPYVIIARNEQHVFVQINIFLVDQ